VIRRGQNSLFFVPTLKLTTKVIASLKAPDGKPVLYFDSNLKGFGVLVSAKTGAKSYVVQRDLPGKKTRRITVGPTNILTLEDAKERAAQLLLQMHQGIDPKAQRKGAQAAKEAQEKQAVSLRTILAEFLAARPKLRQKSKADYIVGMRFFDNWMDQPMREITREMVQARHRQIAADVAERSAGKRNGASSANGAMRTLRALWNYAVDDGRPLTTMGTAMRTSLCPLRKASTASPAKRNETPSRHFHARPFGSR
jgi:Arm DNA-binding domain